MKITILDGEPSPAAEFDLYLKQVADHAARVGNDVKLIQLRDLTLKGCSGCWSCWVKTPGECAKRDDSVLLCRSVIASDLLVFASPVNMGFTTALLKRAADQMIPLLHPYFEVEGGEIHHRARYDCYPLMALLLAPDPETDAEDLAICQEIWSRTARNMKSRLALTVTIDRSPEEVVHDLAAVA